jgi:hypothetical protein
MNYVPEVVLMPLGFLAVYGNDAQECQPVRVYADVLPVFFIHILFIHILFIHVLVFTVESELFPLNPLVSSTQSPVFLIGPMIPLRGNCCTHGNVGTAIRPGSTSMPSPRASMPVRRGEENVIEVGSVSRVSGVSTIGRRLVLTRDVLRIGGRMSAG